MVVGNWPVQFLPAETPLLREAVMQAREVDYEGIPARVLHPAILISPSRFLDSWPAGRIARLGAAAHLRIREPTITTTGARKATIMEPRFPRVR